jgi:hypothetical protein
VYTSPKDTIREKTDSALDKERFPKSKKTKNLRNSQDEFTRKNRSDDLSGTWHCLFSVYFFFPLSFRLQL